MSNPATNNKEEIVVTDAMVRAGRKVLAESYLLSEDCEGKAYEPDVIADIFRAMVKASLQPSQAPLGAVQSLGKSLEGSQ